MSRVAPVNMAFSINDDLHLIVVVDKTPAPTDWETYTAAVIAEEQKGVDVTRMRTLVFTDGGGPDAAQRKKLVEILRGRTTKLAMLSDNPAFRLVGTALSWFNKEVQVLPPAGLPEALKFLSIPTTRAEAILQHARKLEAQLKFKIKALDAAQQAHLRLQARA